MQRSSRVSPIEAHCLVQFGELLGDNNPYQGEVLSLGWGVVSWCPDNDVLCQTLEADYLHLAPPGDLLFFILKKKKVKTKQ